MRLTTDALLAAALPTTLAAQGGLRIAVEPRVAALPAASMWNSSRSQDVTDGSILSPYPFGNATGTTGVYTHRVRLSHGAMPMYGGRLTMASAGGTWRLALDGAMGSGTLHAAVSDEVETQFAGSTMSSREYTLRNPELPLALAQFGVHVERGLRVGGAALVAGCGSMAQQLRTRTQRQVISPASGGYTGASEYSYHTALDPALQASFAFGPASGPLSRLRVALRSTHVRRAPDLANQYATATGGMRFKSGDYRWQWQPELSLGYRLPVLGRNTLAR